MICLVTNTGCGSKLERGRSLTINWDGLASSSACVLRYIYTTATVVGWSFARCFALAWICTTVSHYIRSRLSSDIMKFRCYRSAHRYPKPSIPGNGVVPLTGICILTSGPDPHTSSTLGYTNWIKITFICPSCVTIPVRKISKLS